MCALGQKRTFAPQKLMSALPPKAGMCGALAHVRFTPNSDTDCVFRHVRFGPKADIAFYSITSLACASSAGATVMPSAFAVLRLITNSYLVDACTGRSDGFSPLRVRST